MSYLSSKKIYYCNSADKIDSKSSHSDFSLKFENIPNDVDSAVCLHLSVPKTYDLISEGSNTFILNEAKLMATITIPAGNYSATSFVKVLGTQLNSSSPNHWTYTIVHNNQGKFEISVSGNSDVQPSIAVSTYLYEQLGFERSSTNTFVTNKLISTYCVDFQRESTLFLRTNMITEEGNVLQDVFAENTADYSNIVFQCPDVLAYSKPLATNKQNIYHFYLTDENGNKVDTKGRNIVFTLLLFKKSTAYENINNFIKYMNRFIEDFKNAKL